MALELRRGGRAFRFETASATGVSSPLSGQVWDAALVCWGLLQDGLPPGLACERALELGSGTGVAGVALALTGCAVLLTDLEEALPLLQRNVDAASEGAGSQCALVVLPLHWGDAEAAVAAVHAVFGQPTVDLVLASDCVYRADAVAPLLATLAAVRGASTRALLVVDAARAPEAVRALLEGALADGWLVSRFSTQHTVYRDESLHIYCLRSEGLPEPHLLVGSAGAQEHDAEEGRGWQTRRQAAAAARLLARIQLRL